MVRAAVVTLTTVPVATAATLVAMATTGTS
jgi:hypothetical protein